MLKILSAILVACFAIPTFAADLIGEPLPKLSVRAGRKVTERCVWAPHDSSVCRAREFCKTDHLSRKCAKYCNVNPYDVLCGDAYRPHYTAAPPSYGDSPYPWARTGGANTEYGGGRYCDEHPYDIACQHGTPFWNGLGWSY